MSDTERDGFTLAEVAAENRDSIAKVKDLFGVSHDTATLLWMLMSINNQIIEQNEMMLETIEEHDRFMADARKPRLPGDEWKDDA